MKIRYEPCVIGVDGQCTRWSHDHSDDDQPTDLEIVQSLVPKWPPNCYQHFAPARTVGRGRRGEVGSED